MIVDLDRIVDRLHRALPAAEPVAAVRTLLAQVPHLDAPAAVALVERVCTAAHPGGWTLETVARWPRPARDALLAAVRGLPPGEDRLAHWCTLAPWLDDDARDELWEAIVTGELSEMAAWRDHLARWPRGRIPAFVRTLSVERREAWLALRARPGSTSAWLDELHRRREVDLLTEEALDRLWSVIARDDVWALGALGPHLPPGRRAEALATIRACPDPERRRKALRRFDDELTTAEHEELVDHPATNVQPLTFHLRGCAPHLRHASAASLRRWLEVALVARPYPQVCGLGALLPVLVGADRARATAAFVTAVARSGGFSDDGQAALVPDEALGGLVERFLDDPYAWHRDELLTELAERRAPTVADPLIAWVLEQLDPRSDEAALEIVRALTDGLAQRTAGASARAIAGLDVPRSTAAPDLMYEVSRVLREPHTPEDDEDDEDGEDDEDDGEEGT